MYKNCADFFSSATYTFLNGLYTGAHALSTVARTAVLSPVVNGTLTYTQNTLLRLIVSFLAPFMMATNAASPVWQLWGIFNDSEKNPHDVDLGTVLLLIFSIYALTFYGNAKKYDESARFYLTHYLNQQLQPSWGINTKIEEALDFWLSMLTSLITALTNSSSLAVAFSKNVDKDIAKPLAIGLFVLGFVFQLGMLGKFFIKKGPRDHTCMSNLVNHAYFDKFVTTTYSLTNTFQYWLAIVRDFLALSPGEQLGAALLYFATALGTGVTYYNLIKHDSVKSDTELTTPLNNEPPLLQSTIKKYFWKRGVKGHMLVLLITNLSVAVKTYAGWLSLKNLLDNLIPAETASAFYGKAGINILLSGIYTSAQTARSTHASFYSNY